jgi:S-adenosylmethionine:tRNA ribosyltransferase-isomerase
MRVADFDYELPRELIAQHPIEPRDSSRLMVVHRLTGEIENRHFRDILSYIQPNDLLIGNDSRVIPARLFAHKTETGGQVEVLLLRRLDDVRWEALVKPGRRVQPGTAISFDAPEAHTAARVLDRLPGGSRIIEFSQPLDPVLPKLGKVPLPPYIHEELDDPERYQTVYAHEQGSAAAPTAGLHFTPELMAEIWAKSAGFAFVTLHIGIDTFRPLVVEAVEEHEIHSEWYYVPAATIEKIRVAKAAGGRVIAVGTTATRALETLGQALDELGTEADPSGGLSGWTKLYIYPGYPFRIVDVMITNFHLPRSSLVLLVSAFAGKELIHEAYAQAIREHYRFFSFGDAMLLL